MDDYAQIVITLLQGKYKDLGTWAAVALAIGLKSTDRAAVHSAANGAIIRRVYSALGINANIAKQQRDRLARINGRFPLSGILHYTDRNGRPAAVDLSQRAARLGVDADHIEAKYLFNLINQRAIPFLEERIKKQK